MITCRSRQHPATCRRSMISESRHPNDCFSQGTCRKANSHNSATAAVTLTWARRLVMSGYRALIRRPVSSERTNPWRRKPPVLKSLLPFCKCRSHPFLRSVGYDKSRQATHQDQASGDATAGRPGGSADTLGYNQRWLTRAVVGLGARRFLCAAHKSLSLRLYSGLVLRPPIWQPARC